VAESLTGWTLEEGSGQPLKGVFQIANQESRQQVESPNVRALREGVVVGLASHARLISKDGTERPIDGSAAPIRNEQGELGGVVLVFRDISDISRHEQQVQKALTYADNIIATMREPFVVLDKSLHVKTANRFLPELPRLTRRNRRPLHLRVRRRPVEHSSSTDTARRSAVEQPSHP